MATDLEAEEPCTVCGHGLGDHKHADRCRHEDCDCARYDGRPLPRDGRAPGPRGGGRENGIGDHAKPGTSPPAFGEEPIDRYGIEEMDGARRRASRFIDEHTSRCGNWPASIGNMGGER